MQSPVWPPRPFPKLMAFKKAPDSYVVLFENRTSGMVVHSDDDTFLQFGVYCGHFDPDQFEDVAEDAIVWLTEGPKDPIHQAIEMVDRLRLVSPSPENSQNYPTDPHSPKSDSAP